jgi:GMP synthase (glutamine-hydrolysing)
VDRLRWLPDRDPDDLTMANSKPVLILQLRPEDETADSEFDAFLRYGGLDEANTRRIRVERSSIRDLDADRFAAILVGGSPFDVSLPEARKSDLQLRVESDFAALLARVIERDVPFLGCCSGCSLLGRQLETPISTRYGEPVGSVRIRLTSAGLEDPLLRDYPEHIEVLCGHKEACDVVPRGATLLMEGEACPVQMFRLASNVYATQFHPEADADGFEVRINAYRHHGYFLPEEADALIATVRHARTPDAQLLLRRFVERYA